MSTRRGALRGGHANSCGELIMALSGSVCVEGDNGRERKCVRWSSYDRALWDHARTLSLGTQLATLRYSLLRLYGLRA
jgi:hypothetical protein